MLNVRHQAASPPSYNTAAAMVTSPVTSPASRDSSSAASSATKRHRLTTSASSETDSSDVTASQMYRSDSNYSASQDSASLDLRPLDAPEINEVNPPRRLCFHSVCLFVCQPDYAVKNYSTDFHKIRLEGDTWATDEHIRFWWYFGSRNVRVRVGLGLRTVDAPRHIR